MREQFARAIQGQGPVGLSLICLKPVQRIAALFDVERVIERLRCRNTPYYSAALTAPLVPIYTRG